MVSIFTSVTEVSGELLLVFGVVFLTTYFLYRRHSVSVSGHKLPPGLPSLPIVGSLPFLPTKMKDCRVLYQPEKQIWKDLLLPSWTKVSNRLRFDFR